jgi:hypothetical protein
MFRILKIKDLEERKRALVQESEVYRETLKLECENLRLHALQAQRKFSGLGGLNPLLMLMAPLAWKLGGKRAFPKMRFLGTALFAWKMFRRVRSISSFLFKWILVFENY